MLPLRGPLEGQRGQRDRPALADLSEPEVVADAHVGEEHLVERRATAHLADGPDLDAGLVEREQEGGEASVLRHARVGPADEFAPRREAGARAPDLLAVEDPLVAVPYRRRRQAGEVGAGTRFREQLAAQLLGAQERPDEAGLLLARAEGGDRRRHQAGRDAEGLVARRRVEGRLLREEGRLVFGRQARPRRARPAT